MFGFQSDRAPSDQVQLRQNGGVGDDHRRHPAAGRVQHGVSRHQKQMTKLTTNRTTPEQIKKVSLAENRLEVASENVEDQHVSQEMPRITIEEHRSNELPRVGIVNTPIAQREIITDEARLERIQKKLGDETGDV